MRRPNSLILHATVAVGAWLSPAVTTCSANVTTVTASSGGQKLTVSIEHELPGLGSALRGDSRGAFILLPAGFTPLGVSQNGIVLLRNETHYFRWRAGVLQALDPYRQTTIEREEGEDGTTIDRARWTEFQISARGDIGISTHDNLSISKTFDSERDSHEATIKVWPPDADTPWHVSIPSFSYDYLWDCWIPVSVSHRSAYMEAIDETGRVWVNMGRRIETFDCGSRLVTGLVGVDANGTHHATPFEAAYWAKSINRHGTMVGRTFDSEDGAPIYWVDGQRVDFFPHFLSDGGLVLGGPDEYSWDRFVVYPDGHQEEGPSDDNTVVVHPDGHRERVPLPAYTAIESIDALGRLHGYYFVFHADTDSWERQKAVWVRATNEQGLPQVPVEWERADYERLALPDGWSTDLMVAPGALPGPLVGIAKRGATQPFLFMPITAGLLVDANRDGVVDDTGTSDVTSAANPLRFWVNDDFDRTHVVDDTDSEEDDISASEAASHSWTPDWQNDYIKSKRDLEDFSRLWINTSGLNEAIKTGQLYLGLKWTNVTGTPAIKLYQSVASDGGTGYLTDDSAAQDQLDGILGVILSHAIPDERDDSRAGVHTVIEGGDVFVLPTFLFAALTEATPKTHLLFEGCKAGKGQLQLVILKKDGTTFTPIGEGPGVWLDLKKFGDMYEHWSVGNGSGDAPQAVAGRVASETGSGSAFSYDASSPEEQKYILFVHGWNMEKWEKERFAETAYKRLWWQGYKGRFGLFSWPTTNNFDSEMDAILDGTNFDRGEFSGWRSATPLRQLMQTLNSAYGGELYVFSHSMGGVVTSEALRLQSDAGGGQITKVYVASQAALSSHTYDGTLSTATGSTNVLQWDYNHPRIPNGTQNYGPATPSIYKNWMAFMLGGSATSSSSVGTLVNFYNENDWALSAPVWQFNQITKPDYSDLPSQPYQYYYTGDIETLPFDGFRKMLFTIADATTLAIGSRTALADRYEIMAFAAESRVKALGATPNVSQGITRAVNLRGLNAANEAIWPSDADNQSAHKWHSGEFRSTIQRQKIYWKTLLGRDGFNITTTTLP